jgi:hypothetical protein
MLSAWLPLVRTIGIGAGAGLELRDYSAPSVLRITDLDGMVRTLGANQRRDRRAFAGVVGVIQVWKQLALTARYSLAVNASTIARPRPGSALVPCDLDSPTCHLLDYDNKNYVRHNVTFDASYEW